MVSDEQPESAPLLPHAPMIEKAVLSVLMRDAVALQENPLDSEIFYMPGNRLIYDMLAETKDGDLTRLVTVLDDRGLLDNAGGPAAVADIYSYAVNSGHLKSHLEILRDRWARRMQIQACTEAVAAAYDLSADFLPLIGEPMTKVFEVSAAARPEMTTKDKVLAWLQDYEARVRGEKNGKGMPTGFLDLDALTGGFHTKQIVIVAGKPTAGKSVLGGQFGVELAEQGFPVLIVSLELPWKTIIDRAMIYLSRLPGIALSEPLEFAKANDRVTPSKAELDQVRGGVKRIIGMPFYVEDPAGANIGQILATIRKYHRKHDIKVVVIDYMQLIRGHRAKGANKEEEVAEISHALQAVAKELDLCVILLSQLNKDNRTKYAEAVFEDADLMLTIMLDEETNEHHGIAIKKDRHHGKTGEVLDAIRLDKTMLKFRHFLPYEMQ